MSTMEVPTLFEPRRVTDDWTVLPSWLPMPADTAARKIVAAVHRRRREAIITVHGKVLVWLSSCAPWILRLAMRRGVRSRAEPKRA